MMKLKALATSLLLLSVACVPTVSAQTATAQAASSVQRLPDSVYGYFSIPSVKDMKGRVKNSLTGKMWDDPQMKDFRGEVMELYAKVSAKMTEEVGLSLDEVLEIPNGEVSIALLSQRNKIGVAVFANFKGSEKQMDSLLDKADEGMRDQGIDSETEEFDDVEITVYKKDGGNPNSRVAYFVKDSQIVLSNEVSILEGIISRWDGGDKSFESNDTFAYCMDRCGAGSQTPAMTYFFDPMGLFQKAVETGMTGGNMQVGMVAGMLPVLGLDKFQAMGGTVDMGIDGMDTVSRMVMFVEQPPTGLLKAFQMKETDQVPPEWVGDDAASYTSANWSVTDAWDGISGVADMFLGGPGALEQMVDQAAADENGPGIHAKKDLIDQLTGQINIYTDPGDGEDLNSGRMMFSLGCKDTDAMRTVVDNIAKTPGFPAETRDFRGVPLLEIPNPQGGENKMVLTVANKQMMFSTDVTLVEKILRGDKDGNPLAVSREYKQVSQRFPAKALMVSFGRNDSTVQTLYNMLRDGETPALPGDVSEVMDEIDFSKLPPFEAIRKYFPASGAYMVSDKNGAFMEQFSLTP